MAIEMKDVTPIAEQLAPAGPYNFRFDQEENEMIFLKGKEKEKKTIPERSLREKYLAYCARKTGYSEDYPYFIGFLVEIGDELFNETRTEDEKNSIVLTHYLGIDSELPEGNETGADSETD